MNTERIIAAVMFFLGCLIGVAIAICAYARVRGRSKGSPVPSPPGAPQAQLTAMAVMAMLTAYRCVEKRDLEGAKSSLAGFIATWSGMTARQTSPASMPTDTLALVRSEARAFPHLARLIETRIKEWQGKSIDTMIEEMEKELEGQAVVGPSLCADPHR